MNCNYRILFVFPIHKETLIMYVKSVLLDEFHILMMIHMYIYLIDNSLKNSHVIDLPFSILLVSIFCHC